VNDVDFPSQFVLDGIVVVFDGVALVEDGGEFGADDMADAFLAFGAGGLMGGGAGGGAAIAVFVVGHVEGGCGGGETLVSYRWCCWCC